MMHYFFFGDEIEIDGSFILESTSRHTADVRRFNLRDTTDTSRFSLMAKLVEDENSTPSARARIIYERKKKDDELFPADEGALSFKKGDVKSGEHLELILSAEETRALYDGLGEMYRLSGDMDSMPRGIVRYVPVDRASQAILKRLQMDSSLRWALLDDDSVELFKTLFQSLSHETSRDQLRNIVSSFSHDDILAFESGLNLEMIRRVASAIESHMNDGRESFWQTEVLEKYPWIISQLIAAPCILFEQKAYVGGKSLGDAGGNLADFIYKNKLTNNVTIVEIKTPTTELLRRKYRGNSYPVSDELSGGVNQVLSYRQSLIQNVAALNYEYGKPFDAFSPHCVLIIGNTKQLVDAAF